MSIMNIMLTRSKIENLVSETDDKKKQIIKRKWRMPWKGRKIV